MLSYVDYASLLQYSPRGISDVSKTSRAVKDTIKAGRIQNYKSRIAQIVSQHPDLSLFLNNDVTLIAAPRSSPIRGTDLWPALEICKLLSSLNLGITASCLVRSQAIKKSSLSYTAEQRPSIQEQFDSMSVDNYVPTSNITLVDDVITIGRTSIAAASKLSEKFPNATIRVFSLIRTRGLIAEIDNILSVQLGTISYNPSTGKCSREP
jgi:hypothetical protein